jgi:glutamyl-tRNA synthetase
MSVRVRFAPSNTGYLHIGGARTALFNYLFARQEDGTFILRIEDTDLERSEQRYTEAILEAHEWLGLEPDEGPVFQSNRMDLYQKKAEKLLENGDAYKCYATEEELEQARQKGIEQGDKTAHTRLWRNRDDHPEDRDYVLRIKTPLEGSYTIQDLVQGEVTVDASELDDFVIMRSDGTPTYNFVVVVDDADMDISHVIRGEDHLNNAFRQLPVYEALDEEPPAFGHVPLVEGLSKRKGSRSVQDYRDDGLVSEAVNNYIARLGWSHGDQEIFTMDEMIEYFDFENVGRSSSEFDDQKFEWVNSQWLQQLDAEDVAQRWKPFIEDAGYTVPDETRLVEIADVMKSRGDTLVEMTDTSSYFFTDDVDYNQDSVDEWLTTDVAPLLETLADRIESADDWSKETVEKIFRGLCDEKDIGLGTIAQPTRVATTGDTASPGLFDTVYLLGQDTTSSRLRQKLAELKG